MCRVQAAEDIIGDDADAPDANGLSDAAGVIAAEEEVAPAEKAPVEAVADEAVVEVPHGTSIDLSSDSHRLPTPRPAMPSMATVSPLPITSDDVPMVNWNVHEPHPSDSALNLQPVLTTRMRGKVSELSDLARKVDTKACTSITDQFAEILSEMAAPTDAEEGAADEEADIAPNVVQEVVDAEFWSTRVVEDTRKGMEGIMASNWQDHGAASDVDIKSVHSDSVELGEGAASDVFIMSATGDSVELKDADGHLSVMIQVFV